MGMEAAGRRTRRLLLGFATATVAALMLLPAPRALAQAGPTLDVSAGADRHPINQDIYGINFASPALAAQIGLPVDRWGGNTTDTYNWQIGAGNTGSDYYYENIADCWDAAHAYCSGMSANTVFAYRDQVAADRAAGAKTLLTLPMTGFVSKDAPVSHPLTCGFPRSVFASQDNFDGYDANCGDGTGSGAKLASDPARDATAVGPSFDAAWVSDLVSRFGSAAHGGVGIYELGNEPALWNSTHRDVHPAPVTYDELWQKSRDLAVAVKQADPTAQVLGFSEWGWPNYFCSAADDVSSGCFPSSPDRAAHGGTPLVAWYLQQMRAYQQTHGTRLLDYLDLHYYAQGGGDTAVTRSLWDPTFTDPSWINAQINLLGRMRQWVADNYPGTKIALSEYNLSVSSDPVVNALIQADTLGIFAREGLDLATRWGLPIDGSLIGDAFLIYRDYDGHHSSFGDTWVRSTSSDQSRLAVYGALRSSDGAYTVLVINKTASALTSPLSLSGTGAGGAAQVWRWTGAGITRAPDESVGSSGLTSTFAPRSMTLLVVPGGSGSSSSGAGGGGGAPGSPAGGRPGGLAGAGLGGPGPGGAGVASAVPRQTDVVGAGGWLRVALRCRAAVACAGPVRLRAGGVVVGSASFRIGAGRRAQVRMRLSKTGRRLLARHRGRLGVTLQVRGGPAVRIWLRAARP
jgi:hypothetical protein